MDVEISISLSLSIKKLQDLLGDRGTSSNPRLKKEIQTAITNLHSLNQFFKDLEASSSGGSANDPRSSQLLNAVYSAEDATDTFLMSKEFQLFEEIRRLEMIEEIGIAERIEEIEIAEWIRKREEMSRRAERIRKREEMIGRAERIRKREEMIRNTTFIGSYTQKMKLVCCHKKKASYPISFAEEMEKFNDEVRRLVEVKEAETSDVENSNNTRLLRFHNDREHLRQRQHWGRISEFCSEDETHVVGLQQQIKGLVVRLIPQLIRNDGQPGGNEIQVVDDQQHHVESGDIDEIQVVDDQQHHVESGDIDEIQVVDDQHQQHHVESGDIDEIQVVDDQQHHVESGDIDEIQVVDDQQHRVVIAVVGEGGSGKTTLATSVYNRIDVKRHFTIRAWVRIPSVFKARDVLADILKQINQYKSADETLSEYGLMLKLTKLLKETGTRFLIVLDDVEALQVWESLVSPLSFSSQGGKIIIIVRNTDYLPPNGYSTLHICKLNNEESWKLFSNKVRIAEDELNNSELITLKEQILKICGGLPLTIVLLAGLLSTKEKRCDEWSRVLTMVKSTTSGIVALSYQDLPFEVKPCFLYMGIFPKRFEIPVRRLIHLWCAEGFVAKPVPEIDPEDVAEMFLEELVTRNMVEVIRWRLDGSPKICCLPNVLYDFYSSKAANVGFLYQSSQTLPKQQEVSFRRLAANADMIKYLPSSLGCIQNTRSYVAFDTRVLITHAMGIYEFLRRITGKRGFGLLRVLDLEGVYRPFLSSDQIGRLFLLTYLSLRSTFIDDLPEWVEYMPYLETLDVKHTNISFISLSKANKLRHLYLNNKYPHLPDSTNLRTLKGLKYNTGINVIQMTRLTKLGLLVDLSLFLTTVIYQEIDQLIELQSLKLKSIIRDGSRCFSGFIYCLNLAEHHRLQELYLFGELRQSEINVGFLPPNLRKLTLSHSFLREDPMPVLGKLPHLNILRLLSRSYMGENMTCLSMGFPKLYLLKLWDLRVLRVWTVEEGAMPCLRELEIRSCDYLEPPKGLQNATNLKELVLTNMPTHFGAAVEKSLQGSDVYITKNSWNSDPFPVILYSFSIISSSSSDAGSQA